MNALLPVCYQTRTSLCRYISNVFKYDNMFGVLFFWAISPTPRLTEDPLLVLSRLIPAF